MAPSTYYAAKTRPPSTRAKRDAVMGPALVELWQTNYRVYGAHKLWKAARRAGHDIGRDQVARLMRSAGIEGIHRRKKVRTTRPDGTATRHPDLVERNFTADRTEPAVGHRPDLRPDVGRDGLRVLHRRRLQPSDRRLAGRGATCAPRWSSTPSRWPAGREARTCPGCDATATPAASSPRFATANASPRSERSPRSVSVGDSYDNALAETVNGLYKTELIRGPGRGPWKTIEDVELATLGWVHWHNTERLHSYLDDVPPAEFEAAFYAAQSDRPEPGRNPIARASTKPRAIHRWIAIGKVLGSGRGLSALWGRHLFNARYAGGVTVAPYPRRCAAHRRRTLPLSVAPGCPVLA